MNSQQKREQQEQLEALLRRKEIEKFNKTVEVMRKLKERLHRLFNKSKQAKTMFRSEFRSLAQILCSDKAKIDLVFLKARGKEAGIDFPQFCKAIMEFAEASDQDQTKVFYKLLSGVK